MDVHPPSIINVCPVICFALSDTKNNAALVMSETKAGLPIGVNLFQTSE